MSKEEKFWNWFLEHNSQYFFLSQSTDFEKKEYLLDKLLKELHDYCDKLYFEIGGLPNGIQELIISAGGNIEYFYKADYLVSLAPRIADWQFISLKPAQGINFISEYEGIKIDPKKIWFCPLEDKKEPSKLGLRLYIDNLKKENESIFLDASYEIINAILGERRSATDIQHIEVVKLNNDSEKKDLINLSRLEEYINWKKNLIVEK
jgi:hypothetical protein